MASMKVVVLVTLLLGFHAFVASAPDSPKLLKLKRQNTLPAGRVVELPLNGTGRYMFHGSYLARVDLGNPPQSFDVLIDTCSIMPWVACDTSTGISTRLFNPALSSPTLLPCSDNSCQSMTKVDLAKCNDSNKKCSYDLSYGNGDLATSSSTMGYYLSDVVHLDGLSTPAPIVFGCTNSWSGQLTRGAFDGIFGFAPYPMSFISQLFSLGISGKMFAMCMHSPSGGGFLALGAAMEPGLTYTPLLPSQQYYIVNLESIAVNGETLPIDSSVFRPSTEQFTFVDSGTTLAYLADDAYDPFVNAVSSPFLSLTKEHMSYLLFVLDAKSYDLHSRIRAAIPPSARPFIGISGELCFFTSTSVDISFPSVELHFAGGAKMVLQPHNYLYYANQSIYCIGWLRNTGRQVTLLGDIVLVDKLIVHDLENMRLGWMNYDCSRPVNVTSSHGKKITNSGQASPIISTPIGVALIFICYMILHA